MSSAPSESDPFSTWAPPTVEALQALLPPYEILSVLGRGGMGVVFQARHRSLDRLVAIKLLPAALATDAATAAQRFQNEARLLAKLSHPAIVGVYDFGETANGQLYFVMEYVDGSDLARVIQERGALPVPEAVAVATQVCEALEYAHARGVIHRDIKPGNVLIDAEGHAKVADFGLARIEDRALRAFLTMTGAPLGSADFVAPEVLLGKEADARADLYAVGVMLYQMLTGESPRGLFAMPSEKRGGSIDPRFDHIVAKALQTDPAARYQTAAELRAEVQSILREAPAPAAKPLFRHGSAWKFAAAGLALAILFAPWFISRKLPQSQRTPATPTRAAQAGQLPWSDALAEWWASKGGGGGASARFLAKEPGGSRVRERKGIYAREGVADSAFTDVAVRVTVRDVTGYTGLYVRNTGVVDAEQRMKNYRAVLHRDGTTTISITGVGPKDRDLLMLPPPAGFDPAAPHTFEFHARGDLFTIVLDGAPLGSARNDTLPQGRCYFTADVGALIERFEYAALN